jgi:uroporphyrinogen-III synthase
MTGTLPLTGVRVLVTRPEPEHGPLWTALTNAGATAIPVALLRVEPVEAAGMPTSADAITEYDRIAFTSSNGVAQYVARLDDAARHALAAHTNIAVVGPATARALEAIGARAAVVASEHRAEGLADALGDVAGQRILWPRAEGARAVLAERLRAAGAVVDDVVVYRTIASGEATGVALPEADVVTFTSPSGVSAFIEAFGIPRDLRVACIGPVTADAARVAGIDVHAVAEPYTIDGLVHAVESLAPSLTH